MAESRPIPTPENLKPPGPGPGWTDDDFCRTWLVALLIGLGCSLAYCGVLKLMGSGL